MIPPRVRGRPQRVSERQFSRERHPLPPTSVERFMRMHLSARNRGRECFGWLRGNAGAVLVFEAQRNGQLVEARVIRNGHLSEILRGAKARAWDEAN